MNGTPEVNISLFTEVPNYETLRTLAPQILAGHGGLRIKTSGSTGKPKAVLLPATSICASISATTTHLGASGQWLLTLPANYVAGTMVVLRSLSAGHVPLTYGEHPFTTARFLACCENFKPGIDRFTSLVPTQLFRLLENPTPELLQCLRSFKAILVGGASLPTNLATKAQDLNLPLVFTYGMSETCGGCVYDGKPLPGVQVKLAPGGTILLSTPTLATGYLSESGFTPLPIVKVGTKKFFPTSDSGVIDPAGTLTVTGRLDDVVISGGLNIAPAHIENLLSAEERFGQVCVLGVPDPHWGQKLVALCSGKNFADACGRARELITATNPVAWVPKEFFFEVPLPQLSSGKLDRQTARNLATALVRDLGER